MRAPRFCVASVTLIALVAAGCDTGNDATVRLSSTTSTAPATTVPINDGVLRLGLLRPASADSADIAASVAAGVQLAVNEIRAAGLKVEVLEREEGGNSVTERSINELVDAGVSAIIGPMSSNAAIANLADIVDRDVVACSPTAAALALDEFPDRNLFFRTVPSDSLQAAAIARLVDRTGARAAALVYIDDNYGRPLADSVQRHLGDQIPIRRFGFTGSDASISAIVDQLAIDPPGAVVVIADEKSAPALITALDPALEGASPTFVVNDLARRASFGKAIDADVIGVSLQAFADNPDFIGGIHGVDATATGAFAPYAYDCAVLIALASAQRGSTMPRQIADEMVDVSTGGSLCAGFEECVGLLRDGRNIDYSGVLGTADFTRDGEAQSGRFDLFEIVDGSDRTVDEFTMTR